MAVNVATLVAKLEADIRDFDRDMRKANKHLDKLENSTKKADKAFGGFGSTLGKFATAAGVLLALKKIAGMAKEMVNLAVDAEEAGSAFKTTFGPAVDKAQKFVEEFANKAGFADFELQQLLATTGNIVQGLGATEEASLGLSEQMATLAGDVASFSNAAGGAPAVLRALQSALTGEREALKTYGIVVAEADVVERALLMTHKESKDELTKLDRAYATMQLAAERAGKAVGDLDRTQDSAANTMRRLEGRIKELKKEMGKELLPVLEQMLPLLEDFILLMGPKLVEAMSKVPVPLLRLIGLFDDEANKLAELFDVTNKMRDAHITQATGVDILTKALRDLKSTIG
jgi:ABC-type transporter Mla subunit MlaD